MVVCILAPRNMLESEKLEDMPMMDSKVQLRFTACSHFRAVSSFLFAGSAALSAPAPRHGTVAIRSISPVVQSHATN